MEGEQQGRGCTTAIERLQSWYLFSMMCQCETNEEGQWTNRLETESRQWDLSIVQVTMMFDVDVDRW